MYFSLCIFYSHKTQQTAALNVLFIGITKEYTVHIETKIMPFILKTRQDFLSAFSPLGSIKIRIRTFLKGQIRIRI